MPVWGAWDGEELWFSSSSRSRKARNIAADPRCVVTTDDPESPVVIEGSARARAGTRRDRARRAMLDAKYGGITAEFLAANATIRVRPQWAFGIEHDDFTGSATRWSFD